VLIAEIARTLRARILLARGARGDVQRALHLLDHVEATAGPDRRLARLIEVYLLRALAFQAPPPGPDPTPAPAEAQEALRHALDLARPQGYVLTFLEAGPPLIPLLKAVRQHPDTPDRLQQYAKDLLHASATYGTPGHQPPGARAPGDPAASQIPDDTAPGGATFAPPPDTRQPPLDTTLVEPLTPRELEVLHLVAAGDSNRTIAGKLYITVRTVKKHTGNIYSKLDVHSRTQAIARAHELDLLSDE
jgi:LuxR family maltose regulon positive regulatory protein